MDQISADLLKSTVESMSAALDVSSDAWRDHLQPIRNIITSLTLNETHPDGAHKEWRLFVITTFQRAAYASTDDGESEILDIADWCLEQSLALLQLYPEDIHLLSRKSLTPLLPKNLTAASYWRELASAGTKTSLEYPPC